MIRIAMVDDDEQYLAKAERFTQRYAKQTGEEIEVVAQNDAMEFAEHYKPVYDAVFLDISMPLIDGLAVAKKIRKTDKTVVIVFITHQGKYAIEGYQFNALDFIVKPIDYAVFSKLLKKVLNFAEQRGESGLTLRLSADDYFRIPLAQIYYVLKEKNHRIFHTQTGIYKERGSLDQLYEELKDAGFARCTSGCLVNLRHVSAVNSTGITVKDLGKETAIPVSRRRMNEFKKDFVCYKI